MQSTCACFLHARWSSQFEEASLFILPRRHLACNGMQHVDTEGLRTYIYICAMLTNSVFTHCTLLRQTSAAALSGHELQLKTSIWVLLWCWHNFKRQPMPTLMAICFNFLPEVSNIVALHLCCCSKAVESILVGFKMESVPKGHSVRSMLNCGTFMYPPHETAMLEHGVERCELD